MYVDIIRHRSIRNVVDKIFLQRHNIPFDVSDVRIVFASAVMWLEYWQYGVKHKQNTIYAIRGKIFGSFFVCMELIVPLEIFYSREGLQILTFAQYS